MYSRDAASHRSKARVHLLLRIAVIATIACDNADSSVKFGPPIRPLQVGDVIPDFRAIDATSDSVSLMTYRGKVLVIQLWGSTCTRCNLQLSTIVAAHARLKNKDFEAITIVLDSLPYVAAAKDTLIAYNVQHVTLHDPQRRIWGTLGMRGYPPVIVVDRDFVVRVIDTAPPSTVRSPWLQEVERILDR